MATATRDLAFAGKATRQRAILELVRTQVIRTQHDLVQRLRRRHLDVTQATVSRDLRELGLMRVHDERGLRYVAPVAEITHAGAQQRLRNAVREHVHGVEFVDIVGIVRTSPGTAPLVAGALDGARFDEVAGTVAGDDTVMVVVRSRPAAQRLWMRLRAMSSSDSEH
jgi:transcriptional regulator of arginine metabolism